MKENFQFDVFLSHSAKDKKIVRPLAERLRADGLKVWFDEWQLKPGDSIPAKIEEGLEHSRVLVLCMSAQAFGSDWAQLEAGTFRFRDPLNKERRFIPLRLDDAPIKGSLAQFLYINWHPANHEREYAKLLGACQHPAHWPAKPSGQPEVEDVVRRTVDQSADRIRTLLSECVFLLMADRFPEGLWGRSLARTAGYYGHSDDPGSISVTVWSLKTLAALCPSQTLPESKAFLSYLIARRSSKGAVGMKKFVGTGFADAYTILEHARHTAVAADFFRKNNALDHALDCAKFLLKCQQQTGGWIDVEGSTDSQPDPITTAYVLRTLLDFEQSGLLRQIAHSGLSVSVETYRKCGIHWLHNNLRENGNWWFYGRSSDPMARAYRYTVDVLYNLPELADEDRSIGESYHSVMGNLAREWRSLQVGLSSGVGEKFFDLSTSAQFAMLCWQQRHRYPQMAAEFVPSFFGNIETILESSGSTADGWSLAISLLHSVMPGKLLDSVDIENGRRAAGRLWERFTSGGYGHAAKEISERPHWVQKTVFGSILPVTVGPM